MKGVAVFLLIGCIAIPNLVCADGWNGWRGSGGWGADSPYERCYDPTNVDTFSGEVTRVDTVIPMPGMAEGIFLLLTLETISIPVHLGPGWYIERLDRQIEVGDWIDVKGSKAFAAGVSAVIAAEVRKGDSVLVLRDAAGVPVWTGWQRIR